MSGKDIVEGLLTENKVVIFSKTWCPFCKKAKTLLEEITPAEHLKIVELDEDSNGDEIHAYLKSKTNQTSVPNIFINNEHIGGNDTLQERHKQGKIVPLIAA